MLCHASAFAIVAGEVQFDASLPSAVGKTLHTNSSPRLLMHAEIAARSRRAAHGKVARCQLSLNVMQTARPMSTTYSETLRRLYGRTRIGQELNACLPLENLIPIIEAGDDARNKQTTRKQILPNRYRHYATQSTAENTPQFMICMCLVTSTPNLGTFVCRNVVIRITS